MSSDLGIQPMVSKGYPDFLMEVKTQVRQRQLQALRVADAAFFSEYQNKPKLQPPIREISWSKKPAHHGLRRKFL